MQRRDQQGSAGERTERRIGRRLMSRRWPILAVVAALLTTGAGVGEAQEATVDRYIVVLDDRVAGLESVAAEHGNTFRFAVRRVYRHAFKGYVADIPSAVVAALRADPRVLYVAPDRRRLKLAQVDARPAQTPSRAIRRVDGELSSTRSGDGRGRVTTHVAVLDSGVDAGHADLNVAGEVDCVTDGGRPLRAHGTMVAGLIGARDNAIGWVGIAPGAPLWSVVVFDRDGYIRDSDFLCGVDWVVSTRMDFDSGNDIQVANMSFGGFGVSDDDHCGYIEREPLHRAVCMLTAVGVTPVAAAGNEATDIRNLAPATFGQVLTVTAMQDTDGEPGGLGPNVDLGCTPPGRHGPDDRFAGFSNFATEPLDRSHTVAAPGVCIGTTFPDNRYAIGSGTSLAAPIVAGTVALCIHSGSCAGLRPSAVIDRIVGDAAAYNKANPVYGFVGDPRHRRESTAGRYYGFLVRAGLY